MIEVESHVSQIAAMCTQAKLRHMDGTPTLVMLSGADEYVPPYVREGAKCLAEGLAESLGPTATAVVIPGARHALEGAQEAGIKAMADFIFQLATE